MSSPFQNLKHAIKMVNSVVHHVERTLFFFLRFTHLRYGYNKLLFKGIVNPINPWTQRGFDFKSYNMGFRFLLGNHIAIAFGQEVTNILY